MKIKGFQYVWVTLLALFFVIVLNATPAGAEQKSMISGTYEGEDQSYVEGREVENT